jgi:hypothetical protein
MRFVETSGSATHLGFQQEDMNGMKLMKKEGAELRDDGINGRELRDNITASRVRPWKPSPSFRQPTFLGFMSFIPFMSSCWNPNPRTSRRPFPVKTMKKG